MEVVNFKARTPKSKDAVIEMLRGIMEKAFSENITYLEITHKSETDNHVSSISITTNPPPRSQG